MDRSNNINKKINKIYKITNNRRYELSLLYCLGSNYEYKQRFYINNNLVSLSKFISFTFLVHLTFIQLSFLNVI